MRCLVLISSPSSRLGIERCCLLDSLFFGESTGKILEFFSTGCNGWESVQQVLHVQPCFINALPCFDPFSLIQARNWALLPFLDLVFFGEYIVKILEFLSTDWIGWEPVQQVLHGQPCFINVLLCLDLSSLIRARNWALLPLLDSLFFGEYTFKIS